MNRRMILYIICIVLRVEAVVMTPALLIALYKDENSSAVGFVAAMGAMLLFSLATNIFKPRTKKLYARDGLFAVAIGWIFVSLFGCLPFVISGAIPDFINALFETVSGFTTTGATILTDIEAMPMSLLYWRSFTHWLGGMGVLVFLLALIPLTKNSGHSMNLLRAESPGPQVDKFVPRLQDTAKWMYGIYFVMTAIQTVLLLCGGCSLFESVTTAFSTAGTGGFSIYNDSLASVSAYAQNVTAVFMILFGVNFNLYYLLILREFGRALKNEELRAYLIFIAAAALMIGLNIAGQTQSAAAAAHQSIFQTASIISTTGFSTVNFDFWPEFSKMILILLTICGACAGSTGGGVKVSRIVILWKSFIRDLRKTFVPREVSNIRLNGAIIKEDVVRSARGYFVAYAVILLISSLIVSLDGFSFSTNVSASLTCLGNVGPGLGPVGPEGNFLAFSIPSKITLIFNMLAGRLEIFPLLVLFFPSAWKR